MAKTLQLDFVNDKSLVAAVGPTLTCTRASGATYFDSSGVLQTASNNVARFDHLPVAPFTSLGLLKEPERENICLYSEDLSDAAWVATNVTKGTESVTGPDDVANTNVRLTASAGNGTVLQAITSASATRAYAVWMKRVTGTGAIEITCDGGSTWTAKTLTSSWQRFEITQAAVTDPQVGVRIVTSGDAIDFFGSQCEVGTNASSYIKTTTIAVVRYTDLIKTTDLSWYNMLLGKSMYVRATQIETVTSGNRALTDVYKSAATAGIYFQMATLGNAGVRVDHKTYSGDDGLINLNYVVTPNTEFELVIGVETGKLTGYIDGVLLSTPGPDTSVTVVDTFDGFEVGSNPNAAIATDFFGHIAEVRFYNELLEDAVLLAMSTGTFPVEQFPGTTAGDGGHIWPPRSNDPRWAQFITDSGITATGNFIDDVHQALEAMGATTGDMDTLWKKVKAANSVTDTSEPYLY